MQAAMDRLEGFIARRRRLVLVAWLAIVVISVPFAGRQTENLTGGGFETKGSGSKVVGDALTRDFGLQSEDLAIVFDNRKHDAGRAGRRVRARRERGLHRRRGRAAEPGGAGPGARGERPTT